MGQQKLARKTLPRPQWHVAGLRLTGPAFLQLSEIFLNRTKSDGRDGPRRLPPWKILRRELSNRFASATDSTGTISQTQAMNANAQDVAKMAVKSAESLHR